MNVCIRCTNAVLNRGRSILFGWTGSMLLVYIIFLWAGTKKKRLTSSILQSSQENVNIMDRLLTAGAEQCQRKILAVCTSQFDRGQYCRPTLLTHNSFKSTNHNTNTNPDPNRRLIVSLMLGHRYLCITTGRPVVESACPVRYSSLIDSQMILSDYRNVHCR